ncbi:hypothetical protein BG000_005151, partial [Podila horticola]
MSLFCLVDGEATSNAFYVKTPSNDTVDDLVDLITTEKSPEFDDIASYKLTLWCVSIPITDDDGEIPILLNNVASDKNKLLWKMRLFEVFPEEHPEEMVHIIVQRPLQSRCISTVYSAPCPSLGSFSSWHTAVR